MRVIIGALLSWMMCVLVLGCSHPSRVLSAKDIRARADQVEFDTIISAINADYKKRYIITTPLSAVNTKRLIDLGYVLDHFESGCIQDRNPLSRCTFTEISW